MFIILMKPARYIALCIVFVCAGIAAYAGNTDSLHKQLQQHRQGDTTRVLLLLQLANTYEMASPDSQFKYGRQSLELAGKLKYDRGIANSYEAIGSGHVVAGQYDTAIVWFERSIDLANSKKLISLLPSKYNHLANVFFMIGRYPDAMTAYDSAAWWGKAVNNIEMQAKANSNIANVFYKMGNYTRALHYYLKGLEAQERLGIKINIAADLSNIANVYYRLGTYDQALIYNARATALNRQADIKERIIGNLTTYAMIYNDKGNYDSSLIYLNEALQIAQSVKNPYLVNILEGNRAEAYLKQGELKKAEQLYTSSVRMSAELEDAEGLAFAKAGLGNVYLKQGFTAIGRDHLVTALEMMQQLGIKEQVMLISGQLSASYGASGDYKKALEFTRLQNAVADSMQKQKAGKDAEQLLFDYELKKKEAKIELLKKDNAIIEGKNEHQKALTTALAIGLLMMGIALYSFYTNLRNSRRSKEQILQQKKELELQAEKLGELNTFKDATLSLLAHDLRNPVNALASTMMLLDEQIISPEEFAVYKQELNSRLQAVSILLDNMLYWAKEQMKGESNPHTERLNIRTKITRVMSVLNDAAAQKNISISQQIPEDLYVYADRDHIDIAIRNIVSNAIKFTPAHGTVHIAASRNKDVAIISVTDSGVGMTEAQLAGLFVHDNYASTKGTQGEKGTGIGLQVSYDLIKKNKGNITAAAAPGGGSEFIITLPSV